MEALGTAANVIAVIAVVKDFIELLVELKDAFDQIKRNCADHLDLVRQILELLRDIDAACNIASTESQPRMGLSTAVRKLEANLAESLKRCQELDIPKGRAKGLWKHRSIKRTLEDVKAGISDCLHQFTTGSNIRIERQTSENSDKLDQLLSLERNSPDAASPRSQSSTAPSRKTSAYLIGQLNNLSASLNKNPPAPHQVSSPVYPDRIASNTHRPRSFEIMSGLQSAIAETHSILQTYKTESAGNSAHSLDKLSTLLMDVGLAQEATKISSYAVSIYRSMRATQPDSNFAIALHNYSHHLSASGRTDEALLEARNAVEIYSRLIDDVFDPGRAKALDTLAACLFAVGDKKEALDVSNAAIVISRNLHRRKPKDERLSADLALLLSNRASKLYALRRDREALRDAVESKETYRRLYHQCISDRYTAEYADSLRMYSGLLFDLRSVKEALDPARKAVSLWTELEAGNLDVYSPKLAEGLLGLFDILSGLELRLEAKEQILKAVGIFRRLAADAPDTFNAKYVSSLHKAAWACIDQKRHDDEALGYLDEALGICQMLEKGKITSSAAELYDDKYTCLDRLKRYGEAVQASRSSIAIREQAPESVKNTKLLTASRRDLASALFNLSVELDKKPHKAIAPAREAVNRFSVLFKQAPEDQGLQTNFVLACRSLSHLCTDLKQDEEALKYAKLAVNAGASMEENVHLKKAWTRLSYCYRNLQQWEFERWAEEQASKLGGG